MAKLNNVKALMSNSRSRVIFIVTLAVMIVALFVAISFFSRNKDEAGTTLGAPPNVQAVVGGFDHAPTPEYAKLQQEQNAQQAQQALQTGGTAIPTIIQAQNMSGPAAAPVVNNAAAACTPANGQGAGAPPNVSGTVCSDGTVRDANGRIIGHSGTLVPGGVVYDKNGNVLGFVGPDGKVRNAAGQVIGTIGPDGTVRDAAGNIIGSATTPLEAGGQVGKLVYDKNGHLIGVVGPDGKVRDANGNIIGTVGPDGVVKSLNGTVLGSTAASGPSVGSPVYDKNGKLLGYVGADGKVRDASGHVIGSVGPDGQVRDAAGNIIGAVAKAGSSAGKLVYGKDGKLLGVVGPDGKVRDANGNIIGTVGPDGVVRALDGSVIGSVGTGAASVGKLVYGKDGKLLGVIGPDGKVRDANGNIIGTVGPDGVVRSLDGSIIGSTSAAGPTVGTPVYGPDGKLLGTVGPDGKVRDANGNVIGTVGPDGQVRDASGHIIGSTSASAKPGTLVYGKDGQIIGTVGPDGKVRNASGQIIGTVGPNGEVLDAAGNIIGSAKSLPKAGTMVYDKNGRMIGTVGPDGKVRDANGNIIGTVGPDGVVRDLSGNVIGQAATPTPGTAVYDAQGRLLGVVGADGLVRDANGNVIGTVGADGVVRDAAGNIIGKASYIAPGSPVFSTDGKLVGTIGPDGRLIPVASSDDSDTASRFAKMTPQQQLAYTQKMQQMQSQFQGTMNGQMSQLIAAWAPPTQQVVVGMSIGADDRTAYDKANGVQGVGSDGKGGTGAGAAGHKVLYKAGSITFATLNTSINSDEPGPVLATITDGPLKGSRMLGTLQLQKEKVMLTFNSVNIPGVDATVPLNVVAVDPNTARTAIASNVDNHYLLKYGALFASTFLTSYSQAVSQSGSSTTYTQDGVIHTVPPLSAQGKLIVALGGVGSAYSSVIAQNINTPPTVTVDAGTSIGVLFLSDMNEPPGMEDS